VSGFPLRMAPADADQQHRLAVFRREHPDVIIGPLGFDAWQARVREPDGETTVSRHALRDLLDRLDEMVAGRRSSW